MLFLCFTMMRAWVMPATLWPGGTAMYRSLRGAEAVAADSSGLGGAVLTWDNGSVNSGAGSGGAWEQVVTRVLQASRAMARNASQFAFSMFPSRGTAAFFASGAVTWVYSARSAAGQQSLSRACCGPSVALMMLGPWIAGTPSARVAGRQPPQAGSVAPDLRNAPPGYRFGVMVVRLLTFARSSSTSTSTSVRRTVSPSLWVLWSASLRTTI